MTNAARPCCVSLGRRSGHDPQNHLSAELRFRSCASSPHGGSKKELTMAHPASLSGTDCVLTLSPPRVKWPKAATILKTSQL